MKYIIIVRIKPENSEKFIEISQEFELDFHPNFKDTLEIDEMFLKIKEIYCHINNNTCYVFTDLIDNLPDFENENEIESILITELKDMEEYGWILTDSNIEIEIDDIPLKNEISKSCSMHRFKYLFVKVKMKKVSQDDKDQ